MGKVLVNFQELENTITMLQDYQNILSDYKDALSDIHVKNNLDMGSSAIQDTIDNLTVDLLNEQKIMGLMEKQLGAVLKIYYLTEEAVVEGKQTAIESISQHKKGNPVIQSDSAAQEQREKKQDKEKIDSEIDFIKDAINQAIRGSWYNGETNWLGDVLSFLFSNIPGLNCIADLRDLVGDLNKYYNDDAKEGYDLSELFCIGIDVVDLVGDVITFGEVIKLVKMATNIGDTAARQGVEYIAREGAKHAEEEVKNVVKEGAEHAVQETAKSSKFVNKVTDTIQDTISNYRGGFDTIIHNKKETMKQIYHKTCESIKDYSVEDYTKDEMEAGIRSYSDKKKEMEND